MTNETTYPWLERAGAAVVTIVIAAVLTVHWLDFFEHDSNARDKALREQEIRSICAEMLDGGAHD